MNRQVAYNYIIQTKAICTSPDKVRTKIQLPYQLPSLDNKITLYFIWTLHSWTLRDQLIIFIPLIEDPHNELVLKQFEKVTLMAVLLFSEILIMKINWPEGITSDLHASIKTECLLSTCFITLSIPNQYKTNM